MRMYDCTVHTGILSLPNGSEDDSSSSALASRSPGIGIEAHGPLANGTGCVYEKGTEGHTPCTRCPPCTVDRLEQWTKGPVARSLPVSACIFLRVFFY